MLANRMAYYSSRGGQQADAIGRVRGEITEVKHVMIENIDKVRGWGTELVASFGSATCTIGAGGM